MRDKSKTHENTDPNERFLAVTCCGKTRKSRYCPDCGRSLFASVDLVQLCNLCARKRDRARKKWIRYNKKRLGESSLKVRRWYYKRMKKLVTDFYRWQSWSDQLNIILRDYHSKSRVSPGSHAIPDWCRDLAQFPTGANLLKQS